MLPEPVLAPCEQRAVLVGGLAVLPLASGFTLYSRLSCFVIWDPLPSGLQLGVLLGRSVAKTLIPKYSHSSSLLPGAIAPQSLQLGVSQAPYCCESQGMSPALVGVPSTPPVPL